MHIERGHSKQNNEPGEQQ
jgi:hypothetical protein